MTLHDTRVTARSPDIHDPEGTVRQNHCGTKSGPAAPNRSKTKIAIVQCKFVFISQGETETSFQMDHSETSC